MNMHFPAKCGQLYWFAGLIEDDQLFMPETINLFLVLIYGKYKTNAYGSSRLRHSCFYLGVPQRALWVTPGDKR